jgi:hypothetical protein
MSRFQAEEIRKVEVAAPSKVIKGSTLRALTEVQVNGKVWADLHPIQKELAEITALVKVFEAKTPNLTPQMLSDYVTQEVQKKFPGYDPVTADLLSQLDKKNADIVKAQTGGNSKQSEKLNADATQIIEDIAKQRATLTPDLSRRKTFTCIDWAAMATWVLNDAGHESDLVIGYVTDKGGISSGYHAVPVVYNSGRKNPQDCFVIETTVDTQPKDGKAPVTSYREVVYGEDISKGGKLITRYDYQGARYLSCYGTKSAAGMEFNETMLNQAKVDNVVIQDKEPLSVTVPPKEGLPYTALKAQIPTVEDRKPILEANLQIRGALHPTAAFDEGMFKPKETKR